MLSPGAAWHCHTNSTFLNALRAELLFVVHGRYGTDLLSGYFSNILSICYSINYSLRTLQGNSFSLCSAKVFDFKTSWFIFCSMNMLSRLAIIVYVQFEHFLWPHLWKGGRLNYHCFLKAWVTHKFMTLGQLSPLFFNAVLTALPQGAIDSALYWLLLCH